MKNVMQKSLVCLVAILLFLGGCAAAPPVKKSDVRFFWPPLPATPKVEWLGSFAKESDFPGYKKTFLSQLAGEEPKLVLVRPWGVAAGQDGKVYVGDTQQRAIVVFDMVGERTYVMGGFRYANLFENVMGLAVDASGNIYASDVKRNKVFVFDKNENPLINIGDDLLSWPVGLAVDDERGRLYVANNHHHKISVFDLSGKHLFDIGRRGSMPGYFNFPTDVDIDSKGNVVVADSMNARIQVFSPEGDLIRYFGRRGDGVSDFEVIKGVAVDKKTDNIYVTDGRAHDFKIFNSEGAPLLTVGGVYSLKNAKGIAPGGFLIPQDIEISDQGEIYIVDSMNQRIQAFKILDKEWLEKHPVK